MTICNHRSIRGSGLKTRQAKALEIDVFLAEMCFEGSMTPTLHHCSLLLRILT